MPFSQVIEQESRRWMRFRRTLSKEDQKVFDRMSACATQQLQGAVPLGQPWRFEAVCMPVLLAHETCQKGILPSEGQAPSQEGEIVPCWLLCTLN